MTTNKAKDTHCKAKASASGDRCKRKAMKGSDYCKQHHKQIHPEYEVPETDTQEQTILEAAQEAAIGKAEKPRDADMAHSTLVRTGGDSYPVDVLVHNPQFQKFEIAKRIAHTLANSNLVPDSYRGRPNDCFVAINMGAELGMEPFQAIQSIAVIDGKPCLYGDGLIGVVRASPKCEWIQESISEDGQTATCTTQRKGDPKPITASYSMDDAVLAGIHTKFNWKKHPRRMLQMRARSYCLRDAYPDLLKGLGMVEEMLDHEDTPPPVQSYELPKPDAPLQLPDDKKYTLSEVEKAMYQSDTMEQLLKAAEMAKSLTGHDQATARITYKKMRKALLEDAESGSVTHG